MTLARMDFDSLESEYSDPDSLSSKKIRLVTSYIPEGGILLDIGIGTGELIARRTGKHEKIFGIDGDARSIQICMNRFLEQEDVTIIPATIGKIRDVIPEKTDCITCLDILEHIPESELSYTLHEIHELLNNRGIFIFSGPGIFEKIRILFALSPAHLHSHSSYGWKKFIETAGFTIKSIESVEFPLIQRDFLRKKAHIFGKCCVIVAQKNGP